MLHLIESSFKNVSKHNLISLHGQKFWLRLMLKTVWKVSKYGFFSSPYFPVFALDTENLGTRQDGPEKSPYSDIFT